MRINKTCPAMLAAALLFCKGALAQEIPDDQAMFTTQFLPVKAGK